MTGDMVMSDDELPLDDKNSSEGVDVEEIVYDTTAVRPYAVTGGRTRSSGSLIPLEALISVSAMPSVRYSGEKARIIELTLNKYLSIAELSAHLKLPVGVVRVLVGDLVDEGHARVDGASSAQTDPAATLSILESVLDGISAL